MSAGPVLDRIAVGQAAAWDDASEAPTVVLPVLDDVSEAPTVVLPVLADDGWQRDPRPPRDAIDELAGQMAALCESAVDELEIAAGLEAEGVGDQAVRVRYGLPDVFALAEELYRRVHRRPAEPEAQPELWQAKPREHILHGLLYALPGVCFPAAAPLLVGTAARMTLVVAMLVSWALSQGLSYLGYLRLGRLDPGGSARLLRAGLAVGLLVLLGALYLTSFAVPAPLGSLAFAAGQGAYLLGATVLMVQGAEWLLVVALAPAVLVSTGFLVLGSPVWLRYPALGALAGSALLALVLSLARTRRPAPAKGRLLVLADLRGAVPHAVFGLLAAGLLLFPMVAAEFARGPSSSAALIAVLPLSLSMGAAEWILYRYRRKVSRLLHTTRSLRQFGRKSRFVLLAAVVHYLAAASVLIVAAVAIAGLAGLMSPEWTTGVQCAAYLALGGALFVALLLQTLGSGSLTLLACACALGVESLLVMWHRWWSVDAMSAQLVVSTGLLGVLFAYGRVVLSRAVRHR